MLPLRAFIEQDYFLHANLIPCLSSHEKEAGCTITAKSTRHPAIKPAYEHKGRRQYKT
jgi:hypothetical protein